MRPSRRRWLWRGLAVLGGLAVLAAVGVWWFFDGPGSKYGFYTRYEAEYRKRADQLGRLAVAVDAEGAVTADEVRPRLEPNPVAYGAGRPQTCWFATDWELRQPPRAYPDPPVPVEVYSDSWLVKNVHWYQQGGLGRVRWDGPAGRAVKELLPGGLAETYLLVTRLRRFEPAVERPDGNLVGGVAEVEGFLFDLRTEERVGRMVAAVRLPAGIRLKPASEYARQPGESPQVASARDWLGLAARDELRAKLLQLGGGGNE